MLRQVELKPLGEPCTENLPLLHCWRVALAVPALAQIPVGAPLPAAQSVDGKSLASKAQAALTAKQWPDAEAALKQLVAAKPRWEYSEALGNAQISQGHYEDSIASYQRAIDLA
jgi:tetratricopeptide (TPR) repeat protein